MILDAQELEMFIFDALLESGYAPNEEEIQDITDILIEFLIMKNAIAEAAGGNKVETSDVQLLANLYGVNVTINERPVYNEIHMDVAGEKMKRHMFIHAVRGEIPADIFLYVKERRFAWTRWIH